MSRRLGTSLVELDTKCEIVNSLTEEIKYPAIYSPRYSPRAT